jgi:hypothetical protein
LQICNAPINPSIVPSGLIERVAICPVVKTTGYTTFSFQGKKRKLHCFSQMAIFMAFIGFDGIISSQLSQLRELGRNIDVLSTEGGSQLLNGFYLFLGFCIASLVFSVVLEKLANTGRS